MSRPGTTGQALPSNSNRSSYVPASGPSVKLSVGDTLFLCQWMCQWNGEAPNPLAAGGRGVGKLTDGIAPHLTRSQHRLSEGLPGLNAKLPPAEQGGPPPAIPGGATAGELSVWHSLYPFLFSALGALVCSTLPRPAPASSRAIFAPSSLAHSPRRRRILCFPTLFARGPTIPPGSTVLVVPPRCCQYISSSSPSPSLLPLCSLPISPASPLLPYALFLIPPAYVLRSIRLSRRSQR